MKVEIVRACNRIGTNDGDIFEAVRYDLEPLSKVTLLHRIDPPGEWEMSNEYIHNIKFIK